MKRLMMILSVLCLVAAWTAVGADEVDPFDLDGIELSSEEAGAVLGGREPWDALDSERDGRHEKPPVRSTPLNFFRGVTSPTGYRASIDSVGGTDEDHKGTDMRAGHWDPVFATMDGVVVVADLAAAVGGFIRVRNSDGTLSVYYHVYPFTKTGAVIHCGDWIGVVGIAGIAYDGGYKSTGPHVHYEQYKLSGEYYTTDEIMAMYPFFTATWAQERTAKNTRQDLF